MKNSLSSTLLTFKRKEVITEADEATKYGLPDEVFNGDPISDTHPEGEDPSLDTTDTTPNDAPQEEQPVDDTQEEIPEEEVPADDPTSVADETEEDPNAIEDEEDGQYSEDDMSGEGDLGEEDITTEAEETPGLRILSSLTDKQYQLCNIELFKKFQTMASEVSDTVNNVLMDITPINKRHSQVLDIVHNNLDGMINDLHNYMNYSFSDTYETNVVAYCTFMKRFKLSIDIIAELKKDIAKKDDGNKV